MYFSMKQILFSLLLLLVCPSLLAQDAAGWKALKGPLTFFIANDLGRNGYYEQRPLAELMGQMADVVGPECVFAAGDVRTKPVRQIVTAVADGAVSALAAESYLADGRSF